MNKTLWAAAITTALLSTTVVVAQDKGPHDKAIKARQSLMQLYSFNLGILGDMAKGDVDYNAEAAQAAADNLLAAVSMNQSAMWPPGSDSENEENSTNRALPEIWGNFPEVAEAGKAAVTAATDLQSAAGTGLDALKGAMGPAGKSCKGCHDNFRAEKK